MSREHARFLKSVVVRPAYTGLHLQGPARGNQLRVLGESNEKASSQLCGHSV